MMLTQKGHPQWPGKHRAKRAFSRQIKVPEKYLTASKRGGGIVRVRNPATGEEGFYDITKYAVRRCATAEGGRADG